MTASGDSKLMRAEKAVSEVMEDPPCKSTIWRWINKGMLVEGAEAKKKRVYLTAWYIGAKPYTRVEDVWEFINTITANKPTQLRGGNKRVFDDDKT